MKGPTGLAAAVGGAVVVVVVVVVAGVFSPSAGAGGGCHRVAGTGQTEGTGTTVEMRENCFGPTVLRVEPGTEVTFVNRDLHQHRVDGVGWGSTKLLAEGEFMTQRFSSPGTYPFTCALHLGMNGAVVVGDGRGAGPVIDAAPVQLAASGAAARSAPAAENAGSQGWGRLTMGTAVVASAATALVAFALGRARGRREPAG